MTINWQCYINRFNWHQQHKKSRDWCYLHIELYICCKCTVLIRHSFNLFIRQKHILAHNVLLYTITRNAYTIEFYSWTSSSFVLCHMHIDLKWLITSKVVNKFSLRMYAIHAYIKKYVETNRHFCNKKTFDIWIQHALWIFMTYSIITYISVSVHRKKSEKNSEFR